MKSVCFYPEAQIEMVEAAQYYEAQQAGLGKRFLEAVQASVNHIRLFPTIFQNVEGDMRRCRVERFPFGIVFREKPEHIQIVAVIHFKRSLNYWKNRI